MTALVSSNSAARPEEEETASEEQTAARQTESHSKLTYSPPSGFKPKSTDTPLISAQGKRKRAILFRVPHDFTTGELQDLLHQNPTFLRRRPEPRALTYTRIPPQQSDPSKRRRTASSIHTSPDFVYEMRSLDPSTDDLGDMRRRVVIAPGPNEGWSLLPPEEMAYAGIQLMGAKGVTQADEDTRNQQRMERSEAILNVQPTLRQHPPNMKLQSLPFGFDTAGQALLSSLKRYPNLLGNLETYLQQQQDGVADKDTTKIPIDPDVVTASAQVEIPEDKGRGGAKRSKRDSLAGNKTSKKKQKVN